MNAADPVCQFLRGRGCPVRVVTGGLEGLLRHWETVVDEVEGAYPLGLDDYLDDMDSRQLLEEALGVAPAGERRGLEVRLRAADERMREIVVPTEHCLWGDAQASARGWTPGENWWYFTRPAEPGAELAEDLEARD